MVRLRCWAWRTGARVPDGSASLAGSLAGQLPLEDRQLREAAAAAAQGQTRLTVLRTRADAERTRAERWQMLRHVLARDE